MDSFFVKLKNRGLITLSGEDSVEFLQNLITNDMKLLDTQASLYACLLTPQGKFLHDFFITREGENILIDCEGGERTVDLENRLKMYRLRKNVDIEYNPENDVYAILDDQMISVSDDRNSAHPIIRSSDHPDPRHPEMGQRSFSKLALPEKPFAEWDRRRIRLCIPDGSRDLLPEKSTMDEARMDQLNAIDYKKGCYVGQELTARMHYRGLGKKHLQVVDTSNLPDKAELRSHCGDIGLALVKDGEN